MPLIFNNIPATVVNVATTATAKTGHVGTNLDVNTVVQYTLVALLVLGACIWLLWSIRRQNRSKRSSCCGCALAQSCKSVGKPQHSASRRPKECKKQ